MVCITPLNILRIWMRGEKSQLVETPVLKAGGDSMYLMRCGKCAAID